MQAISTAAAGMMAAADRLGASAQRMAASDAKAKTDSVRASDADVDYVKERTEQIGAETEFKANAAVVRTADAMTGALLDLKV